MEEIKPATEANVQNIATGEDIGEKLAALEKEKAQLLEEKDNYKKAYLKASEKKEKPVEEDEDLEEKIRTIASETVNKSRLAAIALESDALLQKALRENKELKLAQANKLTPPVAVGSHSETIAVADTQVTPDQIAHFKALGWDDKKIAAYRKNLLRGGR